MSDTAAIEAKLKADQPRHVDILKRFVAIPSVSTDPAYRQGVADAAAFVAGRLREAGMGEVAIHPTDGHPVVTASWRGAPGAPTVLVYGHYDVQPPDPAEAWRSPPFAAEIRDGRLYARGASDDKGPMLIPIAVAEAFMQADGRLPVNMVFLFEGEEEVSSAHLEPFVAAHRDLLKADFTLSADGAQWRADLPSVTVASRGICALEVTVRGPGKDLHSGRHGGAVANPIQVLARLMAGLHDDAGAVAVRGFYDGLDPVSEAEVAAIAAIPFDEAAYLKEVGAPEGAGEAGYTLLQRNWIRPTLEFNGVHGGYTGAGKKTVIPKEASAKITCRLVPGQDPARIVDLLARHLEAAAPPGVRVSVKRETGGAPAYAIPADHPGLALSEDVLEGVLGRRPVRVRMGATIPIGDIFKRVLGIDTVFFSFATVDEDYHAPNEFFRLSSYQAGMIAWARYLARLGERRG
ncbi:peptidase M20 [Alsobacter metallidurans]|uniref:Peptidase M20 n=1 Tax=Alsobacter metallidurans TaxID=340221 RepID=A0A917I9K7_9HYPH|nr:dipeptidase [Alsobacter metallidurans]GGH23547.1 peptidase M20 [Alsobacter metallidurans]